MKTSTTSHHLHHLVEALVGDITSAAGLRCNSLQNHIPEGLEVRADITKLRPIIQGMLQTVVSNAQDSCIRISAKTYSDVLLLHVKDTNSSNSYAVSTGLQAYQPMAEEIGGFVDVTSQRSSETTIAFSFPNMKAAA